MGKRRKPILAVNVGDYVLVGRPGVTLPSDWFVAKVLWFDEAELLTEHRGSELYRQVLSRDQVFAVGEMIELERRKEASRKAVHAEQEKVRLFESELSLAREKVWNKLDELCSAQLAEQLAAEQQIADVQNSESR